MLESGPECAPGRAPGNPAPFTFGVQLANAASLASVQSHVRRAEALGYTSVYLSDHLGHRFGPITAMAAAAIASSRLRLATLVMNCAMRNPVVLAQELVTLDLLSDGRLDIGLGAGWMDADFAQAGIPKEPPALRVRRLTEYVDVLELFWLSETFSYDGDFYRLREVSCTPRPHQSRPRLLVGGASRRTIQLAGRRADVVGLDVPHPLGRPDARELIEGSTTAAYLERAAWARAAADQAGRTVVLQMQVPPGLVCLDYSPPEVSDMAARWNISPSRLSGLATALIGSLDEIRDHLLTWRERSGVSDIVIQADDMEAAAPLVAVLSGM